MFKKPQPALDHFGGRGFPDIMEKGRPLEPGGAGIAAHGPFEIRADPRLGGSGDRRTELLQDPFQILERFEGMFQDASRSVVADGGAPASLHLRKYLAQ